MCWCPILGLPVSVLNSFLSRFAASEIFTPSGQPGDFNQKGAKEQSPNTQGHPNPKLCIPVPYLIIFARLAGAGGGIYCLLVNFYSYNCFNFIVYFSLNFFIFYLFLIFFIFYYYFFILFLLL